MAQLDRSTLHVVHPLPIGGREIERVLLRLRRDTPEQRLRWSLGDHGACELDAGFVRLPLDDAQVWAVGARLWDRSRLAVAPIAITLTSRDGQDCELAARPGVLSSWWLANTSKYLRLARAALEELAHELLWCATSVRREQHT